MISASSPGSSEPPGRDLERLKVGDVSGVVSVSLDVDLKKDEKSWLSVATERRSLKKYEVEVKSEDGKHKVVIPEEILVDSTPLWEDFIVGKFLEIAPHIAKVHMVVNKIWSYGDPKSKVEVYDVNATTMRFKVANKKAREKILKRGMWNIAGVPMVVKKWTPKTEEEKQEEEAIPMWVHLSKVPLHLFSWEALSFMTSTVGVPVRLHPETLSCSNFEEAKVFVNVDVTKSLPKEIDFSIGGKEFTAGFYYPWLPARCSICDKWGHKDKVCVMKKKEKKDMVMEKSVGSNNGGGRKEVEDGVGSHKHQVYEQQSGSVEAMKNVSIDNSGGVGSQEYPINKEQAWSIVSPDKTGRALSKSPQRVEEVQISASKYSVLSLDVAEEGEILVQGEDVVCEDDDVDEEEKSITEEDQLEDEILEQKGKDKEKNVTQKSARRGQRAKAQVNPKSKRSSRRNL